MHDNREANVWCEGLRVKNHFLLDGNCVSNIHTSQEPSSEPHPPSVYRKNKANDTNADISNVENESFSNAKNI